MSNLLVFSNNQLHLVALPPIASTMTSLTWRSAGNFVFPSIHTPIAQSVGVALVRDCYRDNAFSCASSHQGGIIKKGLNCHPRAHPCRGQDYILPTSKVDEEKKNLVHTCPGVRPLDASFSPDPKI